jgi:hypothetical protein
MARHSQVANRFKLDRGQHYEGGTESCLRIGGGANWIGNIIGGTGLVSICFRTLRSIGICMSAVIHADPMGAAVLSAHQCKLT